MLYRETGQFNSTYATDQAIFPIRQDRYGMALILIVAFVVIPALGNQFLMNTVMIPFLILSLSAIGLNLLALPLLAVLVFIPPLNLVVFYGLNGYLLGREYYELVALRRMDLRQAGALRHRYAVPIFLAGVLITFFSTVPFLNLLTPVLATAFMVHRVESMRGMVTGPRDVTPR